MQDTRGHRNGGILGRGERNTSTVLRKGDGRRRGREKKPSSGGGGGMSGSSPAAHVFFSLPATTVCVCSPSLVTWRHRTSGPSHRGLERRSGAGAVDAVRHAPLLFDGHRRCHHGPRRVALQGNHRLWATRSCAFPVDSRLLWGHHVVVLR